MNLQPARLKPIISGSVSMDGMREQRLVFGEVAELYDSARAGYPDALVEDVLSFAGSDGQGLRAAEIGAGTGKATVAFAARGVPIVAIEPSAAMAAVARRNTAQFPDVRVEEISFEDWPAPKGTFGLLFAATAWHWVTPEVRYVKAAEVLAAGGVIALFWHRVRWQGEALRGELENVYRRRAPDLLAQEPSLPGVTSARTGDRLAAEIAGTGLFRDVTTREYPWSATLTAESFTNLLLTQSGHRMYPEEPRARLFDGVREIIAVHGGRVVIPFASLLAMARRA